MSPDAHKNLFTVRPKRIIVALVYCFALVAGEFPVRERVNFDFGWRHKLGAVSDDLQCPKILNVKPSEEGGCTTEKVENATSCRALCSITEHFCNCWNYNTASGVCWIKSECKSDSSHIPISRDGYKRNVPRAAQEGYDDSNWRLVDAPHVQRHLPQVQRWRRDSSWWPHL